MQVEVRSFSTLSFTDSVKLWNDGFQGYAVNMTITLDKFIGRIHGEGLSLDKSFVAEVDSKLVGFLLNGIRNHCGKLVAWNGGTGVILEFRGRNIGRVLVEEALKLYAAQKVDYAMLEAISTNKPAISLYQKCGYETVGELTFLQHEGVVGGAFAGSRDYKVVYVEPREISKLPFYRQLVPWQAQWQSLTTNRGEGLIVYDSLDVPIGYALFRKRYDETGTLVSIALHQCVVEAEQKDGEQIAGCALENAFAPLSVECRRTTHNFDKANTLVLGLLENAGFEREIEQLLMVKKIGGR